MNPHQPFNIEKLPKSCLVLVDLFQVLWFQKWKWLCYDEVNDLAFCMKTSAERKLQCKSKKNWYQISWLENVVFYKMDSASSKCRKYTRELISLIYFTTTVGWLQSLLRMLMLEPEFMVYLRKWKHCAWWTITNNFIRSLQHKTSVCSWGSGYGSFISRNTRENKVWQVFWSIMD